MDIILKKHLYTDLIREIMDWLDIEEAYEKSSPEFKTYLISRHKKTDINGDTYFKNKLHSFDDIPAQKTGFLAWYTFGKLARDNDKPYMIMLEKKDKIGYSIHGANLFDYTIILSYYDREEHHPAHFLQIIQGNTETYDYTVYTRSGAKYTEHTFIGQVEPKHSWREQISISRIPKRDLFYLKLKL